MSQLTNKRQILQPILDSIEAGWHIKKPSPLAPGDVEELCIFQHPKAYREARVAIANKQFWVNGRQHEIEPIVRYAIQNAKRPDAAGV